MKINRKDFSTGKRPSSVLYDSDNSPTSSTESSSESESEEDRNLDCSSKYTYITSSSDVVQAHQTSWTFGMEETIDNYKDGKYKPRLHVRDPMSLSELDIWLLFFPSEEIEHILACTNAHIRDKRKLVTKQEFYKVLGLLYAMSINVLHQRRDYWSPAEGIFPGPSFGSRFGMGLHRFEEIIMTMAFAMPNETARNDKWYQVRPLVKMTTDKWQSIFSPGYKLTVDESMFAWYGKGNYYRDGMPAVMKIKRKPKGVGCEVKTIADSSSRIMIGMEINEGKDSMIEKKLQKELGAGTATVVRLTEPWHGTGRIVLGDSWFGSVNTAVQLKKRGLYFIGMVKTATRNYPLKEGTKRCPETRGSFTAAVATYEEVPLVSIFWRDRKVHTFVGTCGTTLPGEPSKKKRLDGEGNTYFKEISRPKLVEEYHRGAPAIDIHNHIRQDGLSLETVWRTQKWQHRMFACILGIVETNAFLAFNYFCKNASSNYIDHATFTENLALQLITNTFTSVGQSEHRSLTQTTHCDIALPGSHVLQPLSKHDKRKRVQRKCVICSRVRHVQQKASFYCTLCGISAVLCSPQTQRDCFSYHVQHGIPIR